MMKGVATLYRWSVSTDERSHFVREWREAARQLRRSGALGCHLLRAGKDEFIGLVRWPSEYARSRVRIGPAASGPGIRALATTDLCVEDDTPGLLSGMGR